MGEYFTDHYLALVPLSVVLTMAVGTVTTYIISTVNGHNYPLMPSISETGMRSPEKFVFSQFINMASGLAFLTFFLRFKMIHAVWKATSSTSLTRLTWLNLILGCVASLGLSIVANCQVDVAWCAHTIGAVTVFVLGTVYCCIEVALAFKLSPRYTKPSIAYVRLTLAVVATISFVLTLLGTVVEHNYFNLYDDPELGRSHWRPSDPGYAMHTSSSIAEWILGLCFLGLFLSLVPDFYRARAQVDISLPALSDTGGTVDSGGGSEDKVKEMSVKGKSANEKTRLVPS